MFVGSATQVPCFSDKQLGKQSHLFQGVKGFSKFDITVRSNFTWIAFRQGIEEYQLFNVTTGREIVLKIPSELIGAYLSRTNTLALATLSGVNLWNINTGIPSNPNNFSLKEDLVGGNHKDAIDEETGLTADYNPISHTISLISPDGSIKRIPGPPDVFRLYLAGGHIYALSHDTLHSIDVNTDERNKRKCEGGSVISVNPTGQVLVCYDKDMNIGHLLDPHTLTVKHTFDCSANVDYFKRIYYLRAHSKGIYLALTQTKKGESKVIFYSIDLEAKIKKTLTLKTETVISATEHYLAEASGREIRLLDIASETCIQTLEAENKVCALTLQEDPSPYLAAELSDHRLQVWKDIETVQTPIPTVAPPKPSPGFISWFFSPQKSQVSEPSKPTPERIHPIVHDPAKARVTYPSDLMKKDYDPRTFSQLCFEQQLKIVDSDSRLIFKTIPETDEQKTKKEDAIYRYLSNFPIENLKEWYEQTHDYDISWLRTPRFAQLLANCTFVERTTRRSLEEFETLEWNDRLSYIEAHSDSTDVDWILLLVPTDAIQKKQKIELVKKHLPVLNGPISHILQRNIRSIVLEKEVKYWDFIFDPEFETLFNELLDDEARFAKIQKNLPKEKIPAFLTTAAKKKKVEITFWFNYRPDHKVSYSNMMTYYFPHLEPDLQRQALRNYLSYYLFDGSDIQEVAQIIVAHKKHDLFALFYREFWEQFRQELAKHLPKEKASAVKEIDFKFVASIINQPDENPKYKDLKITSLMGHLNKKFAAELPANFCSTFINGVLSLGHCIFADKNTFSAFAAYMLMPLDSPDWNIFTDWRIHENEDPQKFVCKMNAAGYNII